MQNSSNSGGLHRVWRGGRTDLFVGFAAAVAVCAGLTGSADAGTAHAHMLVPNLSGALPKLLSAEDAAHYREIFRLQKNGKFAAADRHIGALRDRLLMGHVLYQRYMHPDTGRTSFADLRDWMARYRDHPDADQVHALALSRKPKKAPEPVSPQIPLDFKPVVVLIDGKPKIDTPTAAQTELIAKIFDLAGKNELAQAESALEDKATLALPASLYEKVRAEVAQGWYRVGDDEKAYALAAAGADRSRDTVPLNHWIAGLAAYRMGNLAQAGYHFEEHALSPGSNGWSAAAGAYWAARVHLQTRQPRWAERWLRVAAEHSRTFYGLVARRALGLESPMDWSEPTVTEEDVGRVAKLAGGRRALALAQVGEVILAEDELRPFIWKADAATIRSILAVADAANLPQTSLRAGSRVMQIGGLVSDRALYPLPPWQPGTGFKVDRALIYAFMRQESVFNTKATSPVGARGLMQLMPATASWMADENFADSRESKLNDPELNVSIGQDFLSFLMSRSDIGGDLFRIAVAYNAGPGNLRKWEKAVNYLGDPLLFIESIPARETRTYIEKVLANFWIYQQRLGQSTESLDAIVAGEWPRYVPQDGLDVMVAEDVAH